MAPASAEFLDDSDDNRRENNEYGRDISSNCSRRRVGRFVLLAREIAGKISFELRPEDGDSHASCLR